MILGALGLGAANLGNLYRPMEDSVAAGIVDAAWNEGIRYFDTAPHYGLGLSEQRLGAALAGRDRDSYLISTKAGRMLVPDATAGSDLENGFAVTAPLRREYDFSYDGIRRGLEQSLSRLGLDRVDALYLHDPEVRDLESALATGLPALERLRDEGVIRAGGVGSKSLQALSLAVERGNPDIIMIAGRYTLLEQPALAELLPACESRGVTVIDVAVYNSGLLARAIPSANSHYEYGTVPTILLERARELAAVCREFETDLPTAAMQFPLRHSAVSTVVMGASSAEQVRQNTQRMSAPIAEEFWAALTEKGLIPA